MNNDKIEITVAFVIGNKEIAKHLANAMADAVVEARGRAKYLSERQDNRAYDMHAAVEILEAIASHVSDAAELRTLDG